jgi:O-antigen ligase
VEPEARSANPFGAFINRNHFAAWMLLAAGPAAGYFIARLHTHPSQRGFRESIGRVMSSGIVFTSVALVVIIGTLLLTLSRSAVAGLAAAALTGWWLARPRLRVERTSVPARMAALSAVLLVVVLFVDLEGWASRLSQSFSAEGVVFSRVSIWRESLAMMRDFWATGTGAGTYSDAMTLYQQTRLWVGSMQRWAHFNTAHSHYVQVLCEGGLLLAAPALWAAGSVVVLGHRAVRADKGEMFWVRTGALASLAGLAVQSVWEVALIMPANAVLAGAVAGVLLHHREGGPPDARC